MLGHLAFEGENEQFVGFLVSFERRRLMKSPRPSKEGNANLLLLVEPAGAVVASESVVALVSELRGEYWTGGQPPLPVIPEEGSELRVLHAGRRIQLYLVGDRRRRRDGATGWGNGVARS